MGECYLNPQSDKFRLYLYRFRVSDLKAAGKELPMVMRMEDGELDRRKRMAWEEKRKGKNDVVLLAHS